MCKARKGSPDLIFSQKQDIRILDLERKVMSSVINSTRSTCALDLSMKTGKVFWSDIMEERIYRYGMHTSILMTADYPVLTWTLDLVT